MGSRRIYSVVHLQALCTILTTCQPHHVSHKYEASWILQPLVAPCDYLCDRSASGRYIHLRLLYYGPVDERLGCQPIHSLDTVGEYCCDWELYRGMYAQRFTGRSPLLTLPVAEQWCTSSRHPQPQWHIQWDRCQPTPVFQRLRCIDQQRHGIQPRHEPAHLSELPRRRWRSSAHEQHACQ